MDGTFAYSHTFCIQTVWERIDRNESTLLFHESNRIKSNQIGGNQLDGKDWIILCMEIVSSALILGEWELLAHIMPLLTCLYVPLLYSSCPSVFLHMQSIFLKATELIAETSDNNTFTYVAAGVSYTYIRYY
jgi:hypothetical protein